MLHPKHSLVEDSYEFDIKTTKKSICINYMHISKKISTSIIPNPRKVEANENASTPIVMQTRLAFLSLYFKTKENETQRELQEHQHRPRQKYRRKNASQAQP